MGGASGAAGVGGAAGSCSCPAPQVCDDGACVAPLRLVSVAEGGGFANGSSREPDISSDGHLVAFTSDATDLAPETSTAENVFTRWLPGETTQLVTIGSAPGSKNRLPALSPNGEFLTLASSDSIFKLDDNGNFDVFVVDLHSLSPEMLSLTEAGNAQPGASTVSSLSWDSSRMVFASDGALLPKDDNSISDVYMVDRGPGGPTLESVPEPDTFPSSGSFAPSISRDARFLAYVSSGSQGVAGDNELTFDVFLKDLDTGQVQRLTDPTGVSEDFFFAWAPRVNADGSAVVFVSKRPLTSDDANPGSDVYLWEAATGKLRLSSHGLGGVPAQGDAEAPSISADGRFVAFSSNATNLVAESTTGWNVFVVDTVSGEVAWVSHGAEPPNGHSRGARISGNGRFVAFQSDADNILPGDDNGATDVFVAHNPLAP